MSPDRRCPSCGTEVDDEGLCPRCLLELGLGGGASGSDPAVPFSSNPGSSEEISTLVRARDLELSHGSRIGPYRILELLGEGGMGAVYLAEQEEPLRRRVALKVIKLGMDSRQVIARFESERQALALMDHPHIARVFDAGTTEQGRPYFVMEYVAGIPITQYCDQQRLTPQERLELFIPVCQAIHHAHQKGVIHRDVKPSNVLVTIQDGKATPKVIDFGVAKALHQRLTERTVYTQLGMLVGTPEYMSPEQAEMTGLNVDTTTDVYSLGVLLYELLTGTLPFDPKRLREAGYSEMQRILREEEPQRPSTRISRLGATAAEVAERRKAAVAVLERQLRGDLDSITLKALEKDRTRRYQAATELAADVARYLAHQPVLASPPNVWYQARKFVRRHRGPVLAGTALLISILAGAIISLVQAQRAEAARRQTRAQLVESLVATGIRLTEEGDTLAALPWLAEALVLEEGGEERERVHRVRLDATFAQTPKLLRLWRHDGPVYRAEFSPDGRYVLSAGEDGTARLWDVRAGNEHLRVAHEDEIYATEFSASGRWFATGSADRTARVWDARTGAPVTPPLVHDDEVALVQLSPDERLLAAALSHRSVAVWEIATAKRLYVHETRGYAEPRFRGDSQVLAIGDTEGPAFLLSPDSGELLTPPIATETEWGPGVMALDFHPHGKLLLTAGVDRKLQLWEVATGAAVGKTPQLRNWINSAVFSHDGTMILTGVSSGMVQVWSTKTREELDEPIRPRQPVNWVAWAPDDRQLLVVTFDAARVWNREGRALTPPIRHGGGIYAAAAISSDGDSLLTAGTDATVRLWSLIPSEPRLPRLEGPDHNWHAEYSPDGARIATSNGESLGVRRGYGRVWDAVTGEPITPPLRHSSDVEVARFSADGTRVVTTSSDDGARVWDAVTGEPVTPALRNGQIYDAVFSPDGRRLATRTSSGTASGPWVEGEVAIWDASTGELRCPGLGQREDLRSVMFDPRATRLLTGGENGAQFWDLETCEPSGEPLLHGSPVVSAIFTPDGDTIITGGEDRMVRFWSATTGRETRPPLHVPSLRVLFASPDGRWLAASGEGVATLWSLETGRIVSPPLLHRGPVYGSTFSPDGRWLLTTSAEGEARVWDATSGQAVTPPLWHPGNFLYTAGFGPDGRRFAVPASYGVYRWELEEDNRPKEDIALHAQLLSGQRLLGSKGLVPLTDDEASRAFDALAELYPEHFRDDTQAVAARDRAQAEDLVWSRRWGEIARLLDRPVASSSSRSLDLIHRGDAYAQMDNWDRALADYEEAARRRPASVELQLLVALLRLHLGDDLAHTSTCQRVLHQWGQTRNPDRAHWIVSNCAIRAEAIEGFEQEIVELARTSLEAVHEAGPLLDDLGLALYRAGQPAEALATLERRIERHGPSSLANLVLALEYHRRVAAVEAARHVREAERSDLDPSNWNYGIVNWQERLRVEALLTEARRPLR